MNVNCALVVIVAIMLHLQSLISMLKFITWTKILINHKNKSGVWDELIHKQRTVYLPLAVIETNSENMLFFIFFFWVQLLLNCEYNLSYKHWPLSGCRYLMYAMYA